MAMEANGQFRSAFSYRAQQMWAGPLESTADPKCLRNRESHRHCQHSRRDCDLLHPQWPSRSVDKKQPHYHDLCPRHSKRNSPHLMSLDIKDGRGAHNNTVRMQNCAKVPLRSPGVYNFDKDSTPERFPLWTGIDVDSVVHIRPVRYFDRISICRGNPHWSTRLPHFVRNCATGNAIASVRRMRSFHFLRFAFHGSPTPL